MRGEVGRRYRIEVIMPDGRKFTSSPKRLKATPNIDSLSLEYDEMLRGHYFYVNTHDPANEKNYYQWTTYGIGFLQVCPATPAINACLPYCWQYFENKTLNILADDFINGNLFSFLKHHLPYKGVAAKAIEAQIQSNLIGGISNKK